MLDILPEMPKENKEVLEKLLNLMRESTAYGFSTQFRQDNVESTPGMLNQGDVFGHHTAVIFIAGEKLNVILKVHFHSVHVKDAISKRLRAKEAIQDEVVFDFFKELCNVSSGHFKSKLMDCGLQVALSLPLKIRGFDEFFDKFQDKNTQHNFMWKIKLLDFTCTCTCKISVPELDSMKLSIFDNLDKKQTNSDDDGMDFL
jgi:hypothetical protein